ncbi:hypothetical protein HT102_03225 [Hoyosella sp. G463]|uniref:Uncharacterized protein n=1 Tax=Lolliginicoccus lacisalsi TaxID=2742202 RepID=A0A927JBA1_9ACTN|nr:hypothetical protein [Lolliginicoccus lacisalsi]MBD8505502.1 hypothetical protein [Lolliginicoccus lacisalsi]
MRIHRRILGLIDLDVVAGEKLRPSVISINWARPGSSRDGGEPERPRHGTAPGADG